MNVYLLRQVDKVGSKNSVVEVSDGYARNYLIPRRLAIPATAGLLAEAKRIGDRQAHAEAERHRKLSAELKALKDASVFLQRKANAQGGLFGSVQKQDIVRVIRQKLHLPLRDDDVILDHPIQKIGDHEVRIALAGESPLALHIVVEREDA